MQINYLPAGGTVVAGELEVSPVTQNRAPVTNAALSDIICKRKWKWHNIFWKQLGFHQKYSDIKTPALGFDFETSRAQPSVLPTNQQLEFQ